MKITYAKCTEVVKASALAVSILLATVTSQAANEPPKVVASILPIHSLVQSVMDGVGEVDLLMDRSASPHGYRLRPSQVRSLNRADLIVWVGEELETFLIKSLVQKSETSTVLKLRDLRGITLLENRHAGRWAEAGHGAEEGEEQGDVEPDHEMNGVDPHIWLSFENAGVIVRKIGDQLSRIDPEHAEIYMANVKKTLASMEVVKQDLSSKIKKVQGKPYLVFHDSYQYFEKEFSLNAIGAVTLGPDRKPGAKRLTELRETIRNTKAVCIFREPQFKPAVVNVLAENLAVEIGELDPLGSDLEKGKGAYNALMSSLGDNLVSCLA